MKRRCEGSKEKWDYRRWIRERRGVQEKGCEGESLEKRRLEQKKRWTSSRMRKKDGVWNVKCGFHALWISSSFITKWKEACFSSWGPSPLGCIHKVMTNTISFKVSVLFHNWSKKFFAFYLVLVLPHMTLYRVVACCLGNYDEWTLFSGRYFLTCWPHNSWVIKPVLQKFLY